MATPTIYTVAPAHRESWMSPAQCLAYYKVPYQYREIQIHWWGSPTTHPTHSGVVNYIAGKTSGSVNYVASAGKVTKMVPEKDCAITTQNGNPYGIKIECSPYGTDADYQTIAWLVADIWKRKGKRPLTPHKKYWNTACPGTLSLARITREAEAILAKEKEEMLTRDLYNIMRRYYLGEAPTEAQVKEHVGKVTAQEMATRLKESAKYNEVVKKAAAGTLNVKAHLPSRVRDALKP